MKKITFVIILLITTISIHANNSLLNTYPSVTTSLQFDEIPGATVKVINEKVEVTGAKLVAVYDITGQEVKNNNLRAGIYIVKISKEKKVAVVKLVVES
ncbi:T9SS type A sorting domain-containing protein [Wenyingzhuangia sp. IMCC45467]